MTMQLAAYFQNGDFGGADTLLNAVADQSLTINGKDVRTLDGADYLIGEYVQTVAATRNYAQVQSPSIRTIAYQDVSMFGATANPSDDRLIQWHPTDPRALAIDESLNFLVNTDDAGAQDHYALIWLADGPVQPVDGKIFTVRCTATIAQASGLWVNGGLTFTQKLPVTDYNVVGMRVQAATGIAARLIFPGSQFRPGTIVYSGNTSGELGRFRNGMAGVWGRFNINQPPQLEMLGGAAAAQTVYLDLIKA